ncbi:hypothetical protein EWM64_g1162 [Hericium alpestre]|uniref:F-box domain-containing protein n=1 Tax=Hericium alpestre TaxID=135208 RepID=A0A4Z0A709_9AGAM|nr:hypothetical protein EWM64_g1162 [Hericium alpestre]
MSQPHDIDNAASTGQEHPLKTCSGASLMSLPELVGSSSLSSPGSDHILSKHTFTEGPVDDLSLCYTHSPYSRSFESPDLAAMMNDKGKAVSRSEDIAEADIFSMSYGAREVSPPPEVATSSSSPRPPNTGHLADPPRDEATIGPIYDDREHDPSSTDKGKGRDLPPSLPPLSFSPTQFNYDEFYRSPSIASFEPGPSSVGSAYTSTFFGRNFHEIDGAAHGATTGQEGAVPIITRIPSRRRSLSNLTIHSTHSLAARSMSRIKVKLGSPKSPRELARKLFSRRVSSLESPSTPSSSQYSSAEGTPDLDFDAMDSRGSCFMPWKRDSKRRSREVSVSAPFPNLDMDRIIREDAPASPYYPVYRHNGPAEGALLKGKGRSNSDPFPLPSAFDVVPPSTADVFTPLPSTRVRDYFGELLPRELQLQVLGRLVQVHEEDHARRMSDGRWTALKAASSKKKWVGREQGVRELVRLSRVCKAWLALVFDGQLWTQLESLNVATHPSLQPSTLQHMARSLSLDSDVTRLTEVNLSGCFALTDTALHFLMKRCPELGTLRVKGLNAVTNETFQLIPEFCPKLTVLDMSRCPNITGGGVLLMVLESARESRFMPLKELRLSGLKGITDYVMTSLGKAAPDLEVLDLSYCRDLHNSSLEAFVSCEDEECEREHVLLSSRQVGRDPHDVTRYRRHLTRLRHLSLSCCILLTDIACSHLAHTVPNLEFLELGGIGGELKDDGLVLLLETIPGIRKLDLEDATDITDDVLDAITPQPLSTDPDSGPHPDPEPGHRLEHLIVSYAMQLSNEAFLALVHNCTHLRVLEADATRMSGTVAKEFITHARHREHVLRARCASSGASMNTTARPTSRCHSMWQWKIHTPGLSATTRSVTLFIDGTWTVSRRIGFAWPSTSGGFSSGSSEV